LPDDRRATVERELVELTRLAALGELAGDIGHDIANSLFGVSGLVEILLEDAIPGSEEESRLQLLHKTMLSMKATLREMLEVARPPSTETAHADLSDAARAAVALIRHGHGGSLPIEESYPHERVVVSCPPASAVQALLHLLLAARGGERIVVEVLPGLVRVSPVPESSLDALVAERIAVDHGGTPERDGASLSLRWTG
jgi:signal transduction histidine kinase